ncbi:MAG: signal peptidase I [Bacteroidota bacterium]
MARLKIKPTVKEWIKAFLYALLILLIVRNFFYQVYVVESDSMEGTLKKGDFVLVNKISYGARIPVTPFCVPFTDWYISSLQLPYWRMPGFYDIEQNDVILFNYPRDLHLPIDRRSKMIKRVIGLPGDTMEINGTNVLINNQPVQLPETILYDYYVSHNGDVTEKDLSGENIFTIHSISPIEYIVTATNGVDSLLKKIPGVIKAELFDPAGDENLEIYFPQSPFYHFSLHHFGPVVIPKAGMKIKLTPLNWPLYRDAITVHENKIAEFKNNHFYIEGCKEDEYVFEMDHFFVTGDNQHSSVDSRHWGFVPESHVIGKVNRVVFSYDKGGDGIRWSRVFDGVK